MSWTDPAFAAVSQLFAERTGVVFPPERRPRAELAVRRAATRAGFDDVKRYGARVARDHSLFDDLVAEMTVGETYFFREPDQFRFLRETILPDLLSRRGGRAIRAWSAGCASGEEAYSIAMVFTSENLATQAHVLGTDLSRAALARAKLGVYSDWSLRDEGATSARPYLEPAGDQFRVVDAVRKLVTFEHLNLALDVYPSMATGTWGVDLIFCRNVLIYLDRETVAAVAGRFFDALAEGGWLITASSDPPLARDAPLLPIVTDRGIFYRRPEPAAGHSSHGAPADPVHAHSCGSAAHPAHDNRDAANRLTERPAESALDGNADPLAATLARIRAIANADVDDAEQACAEAVARDPSATELHYLHAVLLLGLGRGDDAARAARRAVYLDRTLAAAHFLLGSILQQEGDCDGARRSYRNARDLAAARPPGEDVPLAEGETAGPLAARAERQRARLAAAGEAQP